MDNIFINWVNHINNLNIFLFKSLDKWRSSSSGSRFSGNNINVFLIFFFSSKILFKWDHIFTWFRSMISKKFCEFLPIIWILVNTKFYILAKLLIEFFEIFSIFRYLLEKLKAFFGNVLLYDLQNFVMLKIFSRNVKW